jgi:phosphate transport system substrate-binding protein
VEPNEKTVHSGEYPVSRYLYCYVNPSTDRAEVADYIAWIRGPEGQSLVRDVGYYPLPMRRD